MYPGVLSALPPLPESAPNDRLALARWLVSAENPLTARVTVNRFWQMLFGEGLVRTPENLGTQGERPTHPQLLDWLAVEFVESGWDVKSLLKTIVMSSTYRQQSIGSDDALDKDPEKQASLARSSVPAAGRGVAGPGSAPWRAVARAAWRPLSEDLPA